MLVPVWPVRLLVTAAVRERAARPVTFRLGGDRKCGSRQECIFLFFKPI